MNLQDNLQHAGPLPAAQAFTDEYFAEVQALYANGAFGAAWRALQLRAGEGRDNVHWWMHALRLGAALGLVDRVHMICHEGKFPELLAQLTLHRLDLVIADEPVSRKVGVKAFNHALGTSAMSFFCAPSLARQLQGPFPQCLHRAPMLIQGLSSSVRQQLDHWFNKYQLQPLIVGEFDDSALMNAFGREGRGVFTSPSVLEDETMAQFGVEMVGKTSELVEEFFAISVERRITHPCVSAITRAARAELFAL